MKNNFKLLYIAAGIAGITAGVIDFAQRIGSAYTFTPTPMDAIFLLLVALWAGVMTVLP